MVLDLIVIAAQPVNRFDIQEISREEPVDKLLVLGPRKILAGLVIRVDIGGKDAALLQGGDLPVLPLAIYP